MGERESYYERQEKSFRYPGDFMSDIGDGMATDKTSVPSMSDKYEFKPALSQHVRLTVVSQCLSALFVVNFVPNFSCLCSCKVYFSMEGVSIFIEPSNVCEHYSL